MQKALRNQATAPSSRPALRYFGGKWALAPWIVEHFPAHRVYVEPFGGAASVLLRKPASKIEVYNDLNEDLVNFFTVLRDPLMFAELNRKLRRTPYARAEYERAYLPATDPVERARRFTILSYMSFNPVAMFGTKIVFSDAKHLSGSSKVIEWLNHTKGIGQAARRFRSVLIENRPALDVIRRQDSPETLFYVDPPYVHSTRTGSGKYRFEMAEAEHAQLLTALAKLTGMVVLSGYQNDLYAQLLPGWDMKLLHARAAGSKRPRTEALWLSPEASRRLNARDNTTERKHT